NQTLQGFNSFFSDLKQRLSQIVQREIEAQLEREVSQWLYREYHERCSGVKHYMLHRIKWLE
ncbi:MAG: hypothetical protein CUN55_15595, partial [Phototrophicales bacterium]